MPVPRPDTQRSSKAAMCPRSHTSGLISGSCTRSRSASAIVSTSQCVRSRASASRTRIHSRSSGSAPPRGTVTGLKAGIRSLRALLGAADAWNVTGPRRSASGGWRAEARAAAPLCLRDAPITGADIGSRAGGRVQPLLRTRPVPVQILLAVVVPAAFGAICGWLLGVNKTAYLVLSILALLGGYAAGTEHKGAGQGALRGLLGGALFGGGILVVAELLDKEPKADLPHPRIWLLAITVGIGVILGALGGRSRAGYDEDTKKEPGPPFDIRRIQRSEIIGFIGAAILFFSLFLNWFATSCDKHGMPKGCNPNSR